MELAEKIFDVIENIAGYYTYTIPVNPIAVRNALGELHEECYGTDNILEYYCYDFTNDENEINDYVITINYQYKTVKYSFTAFLNKTKNYNEHNKECIVINIKANMNKPFRI